MFQKMFFMIAIMAISISNVFALTYIEYSDEDGDIQKYKSMGQNPSLQKINLPLEKLQRTPYGNMDVRDFVEPYGRDLRVVAEDGDTIVLDKTKFYLRTMSHAEFVRLGWEGTYDHERHAPKKHPFFWKLKGSGNTVWKNKAWGWVTKPTSAWFRVSVNFSKCFCNINAPAEFRNVPRQAGADGAIYYMVLQVRLNRPGKPNVIDNRIPFRLSITGVAPNAPTNPYTHKTATTWGALKSQ